MQGMSPSDQRQTRVPAKMPMLTDVPAPPRPAQQSHGIIATGPKNNYLLGKIFGNMQHGTTPRPGQERGQRMFPCFCLTFQHHQEAYHSQMRVRSKTRRCERDWFCQEEPSVWICWPAHHGHLSNVQSVANGDSTQDFQECVDNTFSPLEGVGVLEWIIAVKSI